MLDGTSGWMPTTVDAMAADAIAFINALDLTEADLLGFSLGGFIAQVIATMEPAPVRRMVLAGAGPSGFKGVGQFNRRLLTDSAQGAMQLRHPKPLLFFTRSPNDRAAARDYMSRLAERTADRVPTTSLRSAAAQLVAIRRWVAQPPVDLSTIRQPILVANGEDDRMLATRGSFDPAHRIPNARLAIHPDAGHGGVFQHHERFFPAVVDFLS